MGEIGWSGEYEMSNIGFHETKWAKHYSSDHEILLVGEGDFSFSLSLAMVFGSASKMVATSLDSYDLLIKKYKRAKTNLQILYIKGAQLLHGVDATTMMFHPDLRNRKFDRIVYNFPHAGFFGDENSPPVIEKHRNLVRGFFENASRMLRPRGEVHVTHKTTGPFVAWNIEDLGSRASLLLLGCVEFNISDYPGYNNKRGDGSRCDEPFRLGKCSTFRFIMSSTSMKPHDITLSESGNWAMKSDECLWIFKEYFDQTGSTFGRRDDNLYSSVPVMLGLGLERCKMVNDVNPMDDYINHLKELQYMCKRKIANLQNWLLGMDHRYGL